MSAPDKTSETLNLAEALNSNPSTSNSKDDNAVSVANTEDDQNANMSVTEIDMNFRTKVVTRDSATGLNADLPGASTNTNVNINIEDLEIAEGKGNKDKEPSSGGSVFQRVMEIQHTEPKRYTFSRRDESENTMVRPEVISCPKCGRKVATGAINYHMKFCKAEANA